MTVTGPAPASELGFTLPHEHLYLSLGLIPERFDYPLLTDDDEILADELDHFRATGGGTIVEVSTPDIGRSPERLRALSERTGVPIVMGCGWYLPPYYRPEDRIEERPARELAARLVAEIREGVEGTGIRPGVIGELGALKAWLTPIEERVHRAAAQAAKETNLPILTHGVYGRVALEQLTILEAEGADLTRVAVGHADTHLDLGYLLQLIARGASVMFDSFLDMRGSMEQRAVELIAELAHRGHAERILLSLDVCRTHHLRFGGGRGFSHLSEVVLPRLGAAGLEEATIRSFSVDNPQRWLAAP